MSSVTVDLFVEDRAHEEMLKAMLVRLARDANRPTSVRVRSARGGHGRALAELDIYMRTIRKDIGGMTLPDLLVVGIEANCTQLGPARKAIAKRLTSPFSERAVIACPDPHVERWYLCDPESFAGVIGVRPRVGKRKCERDLYKRMLSQAVEDGGHPPTLGGIEFAREIVNAMDLYRAKKKEPSLRLFLDAAVAALQKT